jgi:RND family efflux transporter, MFP subunit
MVDIGDRIESGQVLARLDDDSYRLTRDQSAHNVNLAEAQLAEAKANLSLAESDLARQASLADKRITPQSEYEAYQNKMAQAEARLMLAGSQLSMAQSQLADAALKLSYTEISATWPEDGPRWIGERLADEGDLLTANTPLLTVVSLDPLLVVVEVIERDYPKIRVGQEAELRTEAWPGEVFAGRVVRVAPVLSANTRQARVELEVTNHDLRLKPGMFAEVLFVFKEIQNVWSVPQDVPFRRREGFVIFVADPDTSKVKLQAVQLGLVEGGRVELVGSPPIEGPVVFLGQHLLDDGQAYSIPGSAGKGGKSGQES